MVVTQSGTMSISMLLPFMAAPSCPNTLVPICVIELSTVTLRQPARSGLMVLVNVHSGVGASEQPDTTSGCNDAIPVNGLARSSGTMSGNVDMQTCCLAAESALPRRCLFRKLIISKNKDKDGSCPYLTNLTKQRQWTPSSLPQLWCKKKKRSRP